MNIQKVVLHSKPLARLQWHPAFYAGIQIELAEDASNLIFENEHQLGTRPKQIDILITKKDPSLPVHSDLGKIFQKYNIIEYKSPTDNQNIDDFYKAYGYACFYKADTGHVDEINVEELTLTFICHNYPRKMLHHLEQKWNCKIIQVEQGIYHILGNVISMQLILTSKLSAENHLWLKSLTNPIDSSGNFNKLMDEYEQNKESGLYQAAMDLIIRTNPQLFTGGNHMCLAIIELAEQISQDPTNPFTFKSFERARAEGLECGLAEGRNQGIKEGRAEGRAEGIAQGIMQGRIQSHIESYQELGISLTETLLQLKAKFHLNDEDGQAYINLYWK